MRVLIQIGYQKACGKREGQIVRAYVNDEEVRIDKEAGRYLTSRVDSNRGKLWFMREMDLQPGDKIALEAKAYVMGVGVAESKTFDALYIVNDALDPTEIVHPGVGQKGFPLLKGRIEQVALVSKSDERQSELDDFLNEEGF